MTNWIPQTVKSYHLSFIGGLSILAVLIFFQLFELIFGLIAVLPLILLLKLATRDGSIEIRLLSVGYMVGQTVCWIIGFLGCFYIFPAIGVIPKIGALIVSIEYPRTTMFLINMVMWGSLLGSLLAFPYQRTKKNTIFLSPSKKIIHYGIGVTAIVFIIFVVANYYNGALNARVSIGSTMSVNSVLYWLSGLGVIPYLFFIFLGSFLHPSLLCTRNFIIVLILLMSMYMVSLTGGRGHIFRIAIFFLGGSVYSKVDHKKLKIIAAGLLLCFFFLFVSVDAARQSNFFSSGIQHRLGLTGQLVTDLQKRWKHYTHRIFFRFANDLAGQLVIENVTENKTYIGFQNFERLPTIFLPKFIIGDKPSADDGRERLKETYDLPITNFWAPPITFMADSFERGGYSTTFLTSFLLSFWLTLLGRLIYKLPIPFFKSLLIIVFFYQTIMLQAFSVIGAIREVTYSFARDAVLVGGVFFLIYVITHKRGESTLPE
ncbi:MAG: hypothetical protein HQM14_06030 [SAR324 cluster bacterium]|nr:hypothetical protein [SAR324 cluster bacterium]